MKKVLLVAVLSLFCMSAFAKVKIVSGNADFLKENATAILVFDYSEASWEEEETYEQWCGEDFDERVKLSYGSFIFGFNRKSEALKIKQEDSLAKYRITVKITTMEQKSSGWGWGRFYALCTGTIVVEEIASGEVVCTAQFTREEGDADYVPNDRLASCFKALGEAIAKL